MHNHHNYYFWVLPLVGIIIGVACAFVFNQKLTVTWQLLGKPTANISKIVGFVGQSLFVETDSGDLYSFEYHNYVSGRNSLPTPILWKKEQNRNIEPDPVREPWTSYFTLPLPFKVKQLFVNEFFASAENGWLAKFAVSEDGNLWLWNAFTGGMSGLYYLFFPMIGLFLGGVLALLITRVRPKK
jgi:hypothetical protein